MSVSLVAVYHDFAFVSAFSFQLSVSISYIFTLFISLFVRSCSFLLLYLTSAGCTWAAHRLKWKYNGCKEASCMINTIQVMGSFLVGCPILWERKLGYTAVLHSLSSWFDDLPRLSSMLNFFFFKQDAAVEDLVWSQPVPLLAVLQRLRWWDSGLILDSWLVLWFYCLSTVFFLWKLYDQGLCPLFGPFFMFSDSLAQRSKGLSYFFPILLDVHLGHF